MELGYEREQIDELCSHFNLLEYVERDYEVKRRGNEYAMHCCFHQDDTPSLFISPEKNRWFCHSCHRGGTPLDWLIKVEHLSFNQAIEKMQKMTGVELTYTETASSFKFFRSLSGLANRKEKEIEREILSSDYYNRFKIPEDGEPHEWIEEGISPAMIQKYDIRIDDVSNRIVYPVYDNDDNLIGVKGRTRFKEYKLLGIKKYINYTRVGTTNYFQGMHENRGEILNRSEAIVFEGIKSVFKADEWGQPNCISAETSLINDAQAKILVQMGIKDVVIAFDNDVPLEEVRASAARLKHWTNVWIVNDRAKLLGEKSEKLAPVDKGEKIWRELYGGRTKVV